MAVLETRITKAGHEFQLIEPWTGVPYWRRVNRRRKPNHRPRDSQRQRLYNAEALSVRRDSTHFKTLDSAQEFLDGVVASKWFQGRWWMAQPEPLRRTRANCDMSYHIEEGGCQFIYLNRHGLHRWVILHELAHAVVSVYWGHDYVPAHGPEFVTVLQSLYRKFLGDEAAEDFLVACLEEGVKTEAQVKPRLTY